MICNSILRAFLIASASPKSFIFLAIFVKLHKKPILQFWAITLKFETNFGIEQDLSWLVYFVLPLLTL